MKVFPIFKFKHGKRSAIGIKKYDGGDEDLVKVLEIHSGNDTSGTLIECMDSYLNFRNMFFVGGGVYNDVFHQLVYSLVELHVHEEIFYYHATSRIDFHNQF